ncbi:hypothetical protein QR680_007725 [Steinernema hermaphroditum]|uniref:Uncharacterized protein n=1 Tax=Steinernema hermaphroditum TaxID=289476 RepID=A0AA39IE27_9BILA|nr:hypothetical protein QR680_007723 [Steinernema hermaphroditum]KAK0422694.1 hypothetical protein QR680_007725 [Steinernema hermaphroditum]
MAVQTPCFNCTLLETGNFILGCCRAVYCAICIGYYLEDCEDDRSICLNNTVCKAQAQEGLIFEFEAYVDALWAKRRAEEEAESELQAHREAAILSLKKVASLPQKILVSLPKKREEEVKSKKNPLEQATRLAMVRIATVPLDSPLGRAVLVVHEVAEGIDSFFDELAPRGVAVDVATESALQLKMPVDYDEEKVKAKAEPEEAVKEANASTKNNSEEELKLRNEGIALEKSLKELQDRVAKVRYDIDRYNSEISKLTFQYVTFVDRLPAEVTAPDSTDDILSEAHNIEMEAIRNKKEKKSKPPQAVNSSDPEPMETDGEDAPLPGAATHSPPPSYQ